MSQPIDEKLKRFDELSAEDRPRAVEDWKKAFKNLFTRAGISIADEALNNMAGSAADCVTQEIRESVTNPHYSVKHASLHP